MPNKTMLIAVLSSALTSTVSAFLSYLAAWSKFSTADNSALAAIIASGLATLLGSAIIIVFTRVQNLLTSAEQADPKATIETVKSMDTVAHVTLQDGSHA
jgi:hypothetical protein